MRTCVAVLVSVLFAIVASPVTGQRRASTQTGLFTSAQVNRGKVVYEESCAACHGATLSGGNAPPLVGASFQASWSHPDITVDDLYYLVRTTMPPRAASSVSTTDHAAVVAYILLKNGYTAGSSPLALNSRGLNRPFAWAGKFRSTGSVSAEIASASRLPAVEFVQGATDARPGSSGPTQATLNAAARSTDWLVHTHDYSGTRHSPLGQINTSNVSQLAPACMFQLGETDNFQTGPIVHNGTMYLTTWKSTIALDPSSCKPKWKHAWQPRGDTVWERNRGVAIKEGRIFRGTSDGYLIALSSETGALLWARKTADASIGETFTMAPVIFEDLVLIGPAGSENNIKGWVGAFRVSDGSQVWRFNTVPKQSEPGFDTWRNPKGIPMGGGAVWTSFTVDTENGDLHIAATNPSPDLPVHLRGGDNLYTNSIVCLDARTGKLRWYRQFVPNDSHDWDLTHAAPMFIANAKGSTRQLVATTGKDGFVRTVDRKTREVLYATPVTTIENAEVPLSTKPTRVCPGVLGGVEWNGPAYNPSLNMLFVPAVDWCSTFTAFAEVRYIPAKLYMGGTSDLDPPAKSQGWVTALDASSGEVKWKYRSPRPMVAAVTTTAGGLVFTGELTGDFLALDALTGKVLYRFNTGGSMGGGIITYAAGGRQYVAAASGSPSNFWVDQYAGAPTIVVFALPGGEERR